MTQDESHLRLLAIFHYVLAAASALFSSMFLFHIFWGFAVWRGVPFLGNPTSGDPPQPFGIVMMLMGAAAVGIGWTFAGCLVVAGRSLVARRRHLFCLVVAGSACVLCNPLGTILGVFTIVVLMRPSVKLMFGVE